MMTVNSRVFQYYLDNFFKFPKEIRNDIVYCQRSLKAHIKVHQMVIDVFNHEEDADPAQKQRILEEIESEIYEINAEQHFLFLRLRRIVDEFTKMLKRNDVLIDYEAINSTISKEVVPLINDLTIEILPATVLFRNTEQKLIEKYFEVQKEKIVYEIEDSDEDHNQILSSGDLIDDFSATSNDAFHLQGPGGNSNSLSQMSLLKPISQRLVGSGRFTDASKFLQMNLVEEKANDEALKDDVLPLEDVSDFPGTSHKSNESIEPLEDLPVSKNVKISRLNLRQALNKARTENMVAKAAASMIARAIPTSSTSVCPASTSLESVTHSQRKYEVRTRSSRNTSGNVLTGAIVAREKNTSELNSSSDDSNPERLQTTTQCQWTIMDSTELRTLPEHYGQEMFLRLFQLFTPIMLVQMQQRRSKRKRRTVHNNERADFHYGRIEYGSYPPPEKKRKAFLISPQVKRVLQSKRPKRTNTDKNENQAPSRSSSSSPDEKRCCNECLKSGGCFDECLECKGYYHQLCHIEEDEKTTDHSNVPVQGNVLQNLCPACKRQRSSLSSKDALHSTAQELEKKLAHERDRRVNLQQESKMYKLQMRNLFNIVNTIKCDPENDSSG
ncbi:uncharacterized protein LOC126758255 [Bactrocera neohumeralis]|uniref:uncharacterized protein LOC120774442 n=1 Tax=Bactrocera tryoni TaxID=59916 RepID=UPI001A98BE6A|nr:uncharacterized protein LOC120774442 [Bactrocera tryoni]XP_050328375.1 uncharacterized protein LOC126758255 [Bactrocera neohumeralis]